MTLRQAASAAADQLAANPLLAPSARQDAELLLLHTLALPRTTLYSYPGRLLTEGEQTAFAGAIDRRLALEPVQYITGTQEFFGLALTVSPAVLIPRPETELLVEAALSRLPTDRDLRVLDVGTGSGAIAIAVASRLPRASVLAVDVSPSALGIAEKNICAYHLEARIELLRSDLLASVPASPGFDAILSNPPYIPAGDARTLHPQVREHEPSEALFAGPDGLEIYRRLIPQALTALRPGGLLALEMGFGQSPDLDNLLATWHGLQILKDLQGIPRVAVARRP